MPTLDYAEIFTNIKTKFIYNIIFDEESKTLTYYIKLPRQPHSCPKCGSEHTEVKGYYTRTINLGAEVSPSFSSCQKIGKYNQRRYRCNSCSKTFNEKNSFIGRYLQMSKAVIATMMYQLQGIHSYTDIAKEVNVSVTIVIRTFDKTYILCISLMFLIIPLYLHFYTILIQKKLKSLIAVPKFDKELFYFSMLVSPYQTHTLFLCI